MIVYLLISSFNFNFTGLKNRPPGRNNRGRRFERADIDQMGVHNWVSSGCYGKRITCPSMLGYHATMVTDLRVTMATDLQVIAIL